MEAVIKLEARVRPTDLKHVINRSEAGVMISMVWCTDAGGIFPKAPEPGRENTISEETVRAICHQGWQTAHAHCAGDPDAPTPRWHQQACFYNNHLYICMSMMMISKEPPVFLYNVSLHADPACDFAAVSLVMCWCGSAYMNTNRNV